MTVPTDLPTDLALTDGAATVPDRATFDVLAHRDDVPGAPGVREVKFVVLGLDTPAPALWLVNTNTYEDHYGFVSRALGLRQTWDEFVAVTYFRDDRTNVAGTVVAHDRFPGGGLYAVEFWPADPVHAPVVATAVGLLSAALPFAAGHLAYHPSSDTHEELAVAERTALDVAGVRVVTTSDLFADVTYTPLNPGESYGTLRVVEPGSRPATVRDVAIFRTIPNDAGSVAGILTTTPQTPLSHINLKARQNHTPNAYLRGADTDPRVTPLLGRPVHLVVGPDDIVLEPAEQSRVDAWLEGRRPPRRQSPPRDLGPATIADLDTLRNADTGAFGAKSANLGELRSIVLPGASVPDGWAVPFSAYDEFMNANDLYARARKILADPDVLADVEVRDRRLAKLRKRIQRADVPKALRRKLSDVHDRIGRDRAVRCRSSTNNEDVVGFNGAGLYDSHTHRHGEGDLAETVKQVWASLWNLRAVDEREFHRIDHLRAAMGVTLHPNLDDEQANGVAVTRNPFEPTWPGFYVNVSPGENLVTNPDEQTIPDELLVSRLDPTRPEHWEIQYVRHARPGRSVLDDGQVTRLAGALDVLHEHFRRVYDAERDPAFAMDVEFKFDVAGELVVKQARPWVG